MNETTCLIQILIAEEEPLLSKVADLLLEKALAAIADHGYFSLVLAGGSTPRNLYARLKTVTHFPWKDTWLFWGDERMVSYKESDSNFGMAKRTLLDHIAIPKKQLIPIPVMTGLPHLNAQTYNAILREWGERFNFEPYTVPQFDFVLLGIGLDGHTASLFPGQLTDHLNSSEWVVAAKPELPPFHARVSLNYPLLNRADTCLFLVTDAVKQPLVKSIINQEPEYLQYPAAHILPVNNLIWATNFSV